MCLNRKHGLGAGWLAGYSTVSSVYNLDKKAQQHSAEQKQASGFDVGGPQHLWVRGGLPPASWPGGLSDVKWEATWHRKLNACMWKGAKARRKGERGRPA